MAGIEIGSPFRQTSPIPFLLNSDYLTAAARLVAGQLHYAGRDYYQRDTDTHYRLRALSKCFAADGTTPATLPGTWGTLEAHWVVGASAGTNGTNGVNGNRVLALAAAPVISDGNLADLAIVTTIGDLYEKTSSGWALRGNLRGPAGTGGTGTGTAGVSAFNTRAGNVTLTAADVLAVVSNTNQIAGGLHSSATKSAMLAIPAALRDYGMTVIVYADSLTTNNGRYDLATDLQTWIKQGIDLSGQFQPYNAGVIYNATSAYVTYPDPVSLALRIFHSLALTAPAMQPAPVDGSNVLSTAWEEISPSAAAATRTPQATNLNLGVVRGNGFAGATGNVNVNADGSMTAAADSFATITGPPTANVNLNLALNARFNNRGLWQAGQVYQPNDAVNINGATYYNAGMVAFTSGTAFVAANWTSFANLYATTGTATDGAMTQAAVTYALGPIVGVTTTGVATVYPSAQQAADAMYSAGGGVVFSRVDIAGPLVLQGNTSLYAPGRTIYCHTSTATDTLTLNYCNGYVECRLIERTQAGTGYALVTNSGILTIKANVTNTQGYNCVFSTGSTIDYQGNIDYTNPEFFTGGGRQGFLAAGGGTVSIRGDVVVRGTLSGSAGACGVESYGSSVLSFNGTITVVNKGRIAINQGGAMTLRGTLISADMGVLSFPGIRTDIYASIDTRSAPAPTFVNAPLEMIKNQATPQSAYTQLHTGAELLSPAGIPSIYNSNAAIGPIQVFASGPFVATTPPDANTYITYLTPTTSPYTAGTGIAISGTNVISATGTSIPATATTAGVVKIGTGISVTADGTASATLYTGPGTATDGAMTQAATTAALAAFPITYAQLTTALTGAGTLQVGKWYILTDYRTTHTIPGTAVTNTGPLEPLLLQAASTNSLASQGYSTVNTRDTIFYSSDNYDPRLPGATTGAIHRRIDASKGNDIAADFRVIKFRRWEAVAGGGSYTVTTNNNGAFKDINLFDPTAYAAGNFVRNIWSGFSPYASVLDSISTVSDSTSSISGNLISNGSSFAGNTVINGSSLLNNTVNNGSINGNLLNATSTVYGNSVTNGSKLINNTLYGGSLFNNSLSAGSTMSLNGLASGAQCYNNSLSISTFINNSFSPNGVIGNNFLTSSSDISANNATGVLMNNALATNSSITGNVFDGLSAISYNSLSSSSLISSNSLLGSSIGSNSLISSSFSGNSYTSTQGRFITNTLFGSTLSNNVLPNSITVSGNTFIRSTALMATLSQNKSYIVNVELIPSSDTFSMLPYAASISIDFSTETVRTLTIATAGAVTFTGAANIAVLKTKELYIINTSGTSIALSFPTAWNFFPGPAPTTLAAGKQAVLTLRSLGTTDTTIKAAYVAQA